MSNPMADNFKQADKFLEKVRQDKTIIDQKQAEAKSHAQETANRIKTKDNRE